MQPYQKKKILYLITKSNWGGAQRYVYDIATNLPRDRFDVVVALGGDGELATKLAKAGIRVSTIPGLQRDISFSKELKSFGEIWQIIKTERPDVLHVNSSKAGGLGAFAGRLLRVPKIIYSAHGWAFNEDRGAISQFIVGFFHWLTIMLAHVTIAVSNAIKHQMKWPLAQRKLVVVQNGRPQTDFLDRVTARAVCVATCPALTAFATDTWTGTIAELHPIKRHDVAIDTIQQLVATGKNIRHIIIGAGELEAELQARITKAGLTEHVFLLGSIHEAATLLRAFDIFVLPSRSEALAYTVIEAAQAGLPIVASRVGGIPEIITNGWDGLLIESGSVPDLQNAIETLLDNPELQKKLAAAAAVRGRHFSLERMILETTAVYNL